MGCSDRENNWDTITYEQFEEGWGVVDGGRLKVRTVSDTRRAAIVNWLVTEANCMVYGHSTDEQIQAMWEAKAGAAVVRPVRVYAQR